MIGPALKSALLAAAPGDGSDPRGEIFELLIIAAVVFVWAVGTIGKWYGVAEPGPVYDQLTTLVTALVAMYIGVQRSAKMQGGPGTQTAGRDGPGRGGFHAEQGRYRTESAGSGGNSEDAD